MFLGRRPLHSETIAYRDEVTKLVNAERAFTIEMLKLVLQAVITGKVRG